MKRLLAILLLSVPVVAQTMRSGTGAPTSGVGSNGDLYYRVDTKWIYGPKASGAWPATYSVILGRGCTTAFHIDWYCTGRGVGGVDPNTSQGPVDPNPLFGVDAGLTGSSPDGTVHTTADVLSKYTTPDAFYAAVGYTQITHYWAITTTGNDGTCSRQTTVALAVANACASFSGIGGSPSAGDAVIMRAGTYNTNWAPGTNGTASNPIFVINYPGERVTIDTGPLGGTNAFTIAFLSYYTFDGIETVNSGSSYAGYAYAYYMSENTGMVIRNCWSHDFADAIGAGGDGLVSLLLERDVANNGGAGDGHDIYLGARGNPSSNNIVQDMVIYNGSSAAMQFNGRFPSLLFTRNIIWQGGVGGIGGHGISFYNGSTNATISNNLVFSPENDSMFWFIYDGGCMSGPNVCPYSFSNNTIINNTFILSTQAGSGGNPVGYVNGCGGCTTDPGYPFSFGSNIYKNNIAHSLDGTAPFNFQTGTTTSDVNSTYYNNTMDGGGANVVTTLSANYNCSSLATVASVSNCINSDPLLVNATNASTISNFDAHLTSSSPAINAGTPTGAPSIDIQWNARSSTTPSIGAYEFGGTSVLTIVSPTSLSSAQIGVSYGPVTFMAVGGTGTGYTWTVTSSCLPSGMSFSSGGVLSGTPTTNAGSPYSCTYTVTDSGSNTANTTLSLTVLPAVPTLTSISPNNGAQGATVPVTLTGTNLSGGTINSIAGITISGVMTAPTTITATFTISSMAATGARSVTVTTAGGTTGAVTFTVNSAATNPGISFVGKSSLVGKIGITGGSSVPITWTLVQHGYNFSCGLMCTLSTTTSGMGTRAIVTTTAGDLVVALVSFFATNSTNPLTSSAISGDTFVHCPTNWPAQLNFTTNEWDGADCYYVLSSGADSSFTWTGTWAGGAGGQGVDLEILEYRKSSSTATFDTGNVLTSTTCGLSCLGPSLGGFSGSNAEVCAQGIAVNQMTITGISGYYSPLDSDPLNVYGAFSGNPSVVTYSAPTWSGTTTGAAGGTVTSAVCFK